MVRRPTCNRHMVFNDASDVQFLSAISMDPQLFHRPLANPSCVVFPYV